MENKNKALIEMTDELMGFLGPFEQIGIRVYLGNENDIVTREIWDQINITMKKYLVLAKCKEVDLLYRDSPLYGAYQDIWITVEEEGVYGDELEYELETFANDTIFYDYSETDLEEMIKHYSIANLED